MLVIFFLSHVSVLVSEQITAAMSEPLVCAWEAGSIEEMDT